MKAIIRIAPKYRPVSRELIGYRLQACTPNLAARKMFGKDDGSFVITKKMVPSFKSPYLIAEGSDLSQVSESDLARFKQKLEWEGFTEFEMMKSGQQRDEKALSAEQRAQLDALMTALDLKPATA